MINVIIGGGAAGIFAAIRCKKQNPSSHVIVLEKSDQFLSKVRISGGGRCNVTNACFDAKTLAQNYPRGSKELIGPFHYFQPKDTLAWFEEHGVALKIEEDNRVFPRTDSSETIINCLLTAAKDIDLRKRQNILSIQKIDQKFIIQLQDQQIIADHILLATGSSSWGYEIAKSFGHTIIEPIPSLFSFNAPTSPLLDLSGISVPNVILTLKNTPFKQEGALLLTHWGFSGPAVLKLSAWAARKLYELDYKATLIINWTAAKNQEAIYQTLLKHGKNPRLLPSNLFTRLLKILCIERLSNSSLRQLAEKLYADTYAIEGKSNYKQEFVTTGGINLKEVDFKTMQSRFTPGLFFAGEILDIDGLTGGFNFQNAWTTGWIAATHMS